MKCSGPLADCERNSVWISSTPLTGGPNWRVAGNANKYFHQNVNLKTGDDADSCGAALW